MTKKTMIAVFAIIIVLLSAVYLFYRAGLKTEETSGSQPSPSSEAMGPKTEKPLCRVLVEQPSCYAGSFPAPVFKWEYCDSYDQKSFRIRVSRNAYKDSTFLSPEIDTQKIESTSQEYAVSGPGLDFGESYYWGVDIESSGGQLSGWWGWGDTSFKTASSCD